jgi:hypothetical protein
MDPATLFLLLRGSLALLIALGGILTLNYAVRLMRGKLAQRAEGQPARFSFGFGKARLSFSSQDAGLALAFSALAWAFAAVLAAPKSIKMVDGGGLSDPTVEIASTPPSESAQHPTSWHVAGEERLASLIRVEDPAGAKTASVVVLSHALPETAPDTQAGVAPDTESFAAIFEPRAEAVPAILELGESVGVHEGRIELKVEPDGTVTSVRAVGPGGQIADEVAVAPELATRFFVSGNAPEPAQATWVQADLYRGQTLTAPEPGEATPPPMP